MVVAWQPGWVQVEMVGRCSQTDTVRPLEQAHKILDTAPFGNHDREADSDVADTRHVSLARLQVLKLLSHLTLGRS